MKKCAGLPTKDPQVVRDAYLDLWGGERQRFKVFRTDNGGEFERCFHEALVRRGIHHSLSLPHRPSTNSRIEDKVRRVIEGTRAVLAASGLPFDVRPPHVPADCRSGAATRPAPFAGVAAADDGSVLVAVNGAGYVLRVGP